MGWKPAAFAEIEPFPAAVLAHHFPNVPNLGDMTKFKEWNIGQIDLLVGGTPCQAFSVAGLRGGLSDARGNLTLTFVEMSDHFNPDWIVWENVPGVLSSQDNAFGCFLAGLVGASEPLIPDGRWDNAGVVSGPKRTAAWRVLDAQYFGVAQRRRRVFVCAVRGARNWAAARAFFPFGESVYRDSPPRREARQGLAKCLTRGIGQRYDSETETMITAHAFKVRQGCEGSGKGYLGSDELAFTISTHQDQHIAQPISFAQNQLGEVRTGEVMGTLNTNSNASGRCTPMVAQPITFGAQMSTPQTDVDLVQTLQAKNPMAVAQPIAIQGNLIGRDNGGPQGIGVSESGAMYTLTKADVHGVALPVAFTRCDHGGDAVVDGTPTMRCGSNYSAHLAVAQPVAFRETADCLTAAYGTKWNGNASADNGSLFAAQAVAPSLTASNDPSRSPQSSEVTQQVAAVHSASMQVRRLTPTECERLQGFPDGWTNIPWRGKPESPDGPRYKALGNSMAVPCMRWIGERIQLVQSNKI
jgi:DNA (cytosine-5)-methyltransferase 1